MMTAALPADATATSADYEALTPLAERLVAKHHLRGASLLVGDTSGVLYRRHFGGYDDDTVALIASASKWLGAAALMALVDEGDLSLDTTVGEYFPDAAQPLASATVRQLFAHTSGLPGTHFGFGPRGATLAESAELVLAMRTSGQPGEKFNYGGASMQLAGRMAELATGRAWEDLFAEKITEPLGMSHTHYGRLEGAGNPKLGAGVRSGLDDYARFLQMILAKGTWQGRRILSPESVDAIEADQVGEARRLGFAPGDTRRLPHGIYGLGVWRFTELAPGQIGIVSSPGAYGFFPWVDRGRGLYGILMVQQLRTTRPPAHEWGREILKKTCEIYDGM